jgi:4-hydroxybenzoate polyprenyltransferase
MKAIKKVLRRLRLYGELVMFSHTLFSLPFALSSMLMAAGGFPGFRKAFWILAAFTGARNGANALNRFVDRHIDKKNPRTASRHLPAGILHRREALALALAGFLLLAFSAYRLNPLCLALLPLAVFIMVIYSYTKRFTWLCHFVLGAACSGASLGAWIAVTGGLSWTALVLTGANALWVTGFDIIYGSSDIEFDRQEGLYSVPARFGKRAAAFLAAGLHLSTILLLLAAGISNGRGLFFFAGVLACALLLAVEHRLVVKEKILLASYQMNQIMGMTFLLFVALDFLFPRS